MTDTRRVPISARVAPELARRLRAAAIQQGRPITELVEQALAAAPWAAEPPPPALAGSCTVEHGAAPCPGRHHVVSPLDGEQDGWRCSCGRTFTSESGFAVCPDAPLRLAD